MDYLNRIHTSLRCNEDQEWLCLTNNHRCDTCVIHKGVQK